MTGPAAATPGQVRDVAAEVLDVLVTRGQTVAVAESLTGGLLAATLVDVPGASRAFRGGLVVYATDLKASLAGVADELLRVAGPVDPQVALALARGARTRCCADWGLATTGVAGPDPQDGIPVGTVYVAIAGPAGTASTAGPAGTASTAGPAGTASTAGPAAPGDTAGPAGAVSGAGSAGAASGGGSAAGPVAPGWEAVRRLDLTGSRAAIRAGAVAAALDLLAAALRQPPASAPG